MSDEGRTIIPHVRTGLAAASPAQRVIELTQHVTSLGQAHAVLEAKLEALQKDHDKWRSFRDTSFGGVPMAQYWVDLFLWEAVLNSHPVKGIVEIGTWKGGLSGWLWAQADIRGIYFETFDVVVPEIFKGQYDRDYEGTQVRHSFTKKDVYRHPESVRRALRDAERQGPAILFCDGGNKPRELEMFPPFLRQPESLVFVHDWGTETLRSDVPDNLVEVYGDFCDELGSVTRIFKVKQ